MEAGESKMIATKEKTQKLEKIATDSSNTFQDWFGFQYEEGPGATIGEEEKEQNKQAYIDFWKLMVAEAEKARVGGEPCEYDEICSGRDLNCLNTKTKHCILYRMISTSSKRADYFEGRIREAKKQGKDVSQLAYYVDLARNRISKQKFRNARIYLGIVKRKLNELEKDN